MGDSFLDTLFWCNNHILERTNLYWTVLCKGLWYRICVRKRSYTDTSNFTLRCGVCQIGVIGQKVCNTTYLYNPFIRLVYISLYLLYAFFCNKTLHVITGSSPACRSNGTCQLSRIQVRWKREDRTWSFSSFLKWIKLFHGIVCFDQISVTYWIDVVRYKNLPYRKSCICKNIRCCTIWFEVYTLQKVLVINKNWFVLVEYFIYVCTYLIDKCIVSLTSPNRP